MNYLISHQSLVKSCQDAAVGHQSSFMCHVKRLSSEMFHPSWVLYKFAKSLSVVSLSCICYHAGVYIVQNTMARGGGEKNGAGEKK